MFQMAFSWIDCYKDQLGLLVQSLLFVATIVLIRVGWKQAKAADAQAKAAGAQVVAANEQATTAKKQLDMSIQEMFASLSAADAASRPLLHVIAIPNSDSEYVGDYLECLIENKGLGPALDMDAFYGRGPNDVDDSSKAAGLTGDFMGIGEKKTSKFDLQRAQAEGLTVRYTSTHGSTYETTFNNFFDGEFIEMHKRVKNAVIGLADLKF